MDNPLLTFNPGLMVWTLVTFFLAMAILRAKVFGRLQEALENRRNAIAESVEQAERTRDEAQKVLENYRQQLAQARVEAEGIIERSRKAGDELSARMKVEADEQRRQAVAQTQQQIQTEVEKAVEDLRGAIADMTIAATEKVTRGAIDASTQQSLVDQAIAELNVDELQKVGAR